MKKDLPQEGLKLIACITMLLDHIGAALLPGIGLRLIGRLAFPIYCFLLCEGERRTRSPGKYALRLFIGAVLSELPFDLLFYGRFTWAHQSVMVTLLLAFGMLTAMRRVRQGIVKLLVMLPFALAAELLSTDYGGMGVVMVALFYLTEGLPSRLPLQLAGLTAVNLLLPSSRFYGIPIQLFAGAALLPIACYRGRKLSRSKSLQWAFYLFYPVHLALLLLVRLL